MARKEELIEGTEGIAKFLKRSRMTISRWTKLIPLPEPESKVHNMWHTWRYWTKTQITQWHNSLVDKKRDEYSGCTRRLYTKRRERWAR